MVHSFFIVLFMTWDKEFINETTNLNFRHFRRKSEALFLSYWNSVNYIISFESPNYTYESKYISIKVLDMSCEVGSSL